MPHQFRLFHFLYNIEVNRSRSKSLKKQIKQIKSNRRRAFNLNFYISSLNDIISEIKVLNTSLIIKFDKPLEAFFFIIVKILA